MRRIYRIVLMGLFLAGSVVSPVKAENWPGWRGPRGDGSSLDKDVPVKWDLKEEINWKTELPGVGHASPIVWENRVFTVTCIPETEERALLCLDAFNGRLLWKKTVIKSPLEKKHTLNSHASSTPATDGALVYVAFLDVQEMVVAAYDFEGKQKWLVRPGVFKSVHGFCSSPVLFNDKVIVNGDHDGDSYIVALNRATGKTLWKIPRENHTRSYCAPIIRNLSGRNQMILSGDKTVASYDPDTGKRHWIIQGPTEQFVASLVYNPKADLLFMTGGFPQHHLMGIRHNGTGDVTESAVAWHVTKASCVSYVPSPISIDNYFIVVSDTGHVNCFEASSGNLLWQERVGSHHASPVSADGYVYLLSDKGVVTVIKPGPEFKIAAQNDLGEASFASPAISDGHFFIRAEKNLYCICGCP